MHSIVIVMVIWIEMTLMELMAACIDCTVRNI
jgi:hypothetical protein